MSINIRYQNSILRILCVFTVIAAFTLMFNGCGAFAESSLRFKGEGTKESPYLIASAEDLMMFAEYVNDGRSFAGCYFEQTDDIDLSGEKWAPIGACNTDNYFDGIYNGGGHVIHGLKTDVGITTAQKGALFGQLAGVVMNLGIEDSEIKGYYAASFAAHAVENTDPAIINCYSRAQIYGIRTGGIVDDFDGGIVINSWFDGSLHGATAGNISSSGGTLVECYEAGDSEKAAEPFELIRSHSDPDKAEITYDSQKHGLAMVYSSRYVSRDMVIPWEYKGGELEFGEERFEEPQLAFEGKGTKDDPYLINSYEDLCTFRDLVNYGKSFAGEWFMQTSDIRIETDDWLPVGVYGLGNYFYGYYDGASHIIDGLVCESHGDDKLDNNALFGHLGGVVMNLGLENVIIDGSCCGSIASHTSSYNYTSAIINCYATGSVKGVRASGIVYDFGNSSVINCWFDGTLDGTLTENVISYTGESIECFDNSPEEEKVHESKYVLASSFKSQSEVTVEAQQRSYSAYYVSRYGVDSDMLYPWVWNGNRLVFDDERMSAVEVDFDGNGTKDDPYLIHDYDDLCILRHLVNSGNTFENEWFRQTSDIVMETDDWLPIGVYGSGNYFWGTYDGAGHVIYDLTCRDHSNGISDNNGLFGQLGGVIVNLGLENVSISGSNCGTFASSSANGLERTAAIINCYATGSVTADRPAGIVDNLLRGTIANCLSNVELHFHNEDELSAEEYSSRRDSSFGGITAVSTDAKVFETQTTAYQVMPEAHRSATSALISEADTKTSEFIDELNIRTALTQELFGDQFGVELMQWQVSDGDNWLGYSSSADILGLADFLNKYLLVFLLGLIMLISLIKLMCARSFRVYWNKYSQKIVAMAVITGIVSFFVDCAALGSAREYLTLSGSIFIAQINVYFLCMLGLCLRFGSFSLRDLRINWLLAIFMLILLVLELMQFDSVPRYDASLYYGSLARGASLFRLDTLSYIGAFVCWKWLQGSALLLAPFEFLIPGEMVGVYISNVIITEVTLVVLYRLIRDCIPNLSSATAAILSTILILCPYQLGMFTYLCLDTHCVYYAIWLMYACRRQNHLLIGFCGYLLFFTKISGGAFYVVYLMGAAFLEVVTIYKGNLIKRIVRWWNWEKVFFWVLPAVLYLVSMVIGEHFTIQHFNGANLVPPIADKSVVSLKNTLAQSFVFGFRWVFVGLIALAFIVWLIRYRNFRGLISPFGICTFFPAVAAGLAVIAVLLLYNSDAECPRYTALMNVVYAVMTPLAVNIIFRKNSAKRNTAAVLAVLLLVQTYWTIDPSIILNETHIDTGTNKLYRIALDGDDRPGMNLGMDYSLGYTSVGDIYAYNIEYNYYDDLIHSALREIDPDEDDLMYVLDVIDYELHLRGNQYFIYWNTRDKRITYNGDDPDSVLLRQGMITTETIVDYADRGANIGSEFYLIVPSRVDTTASMQALERIGYTLVKEYCYENRYGSMHVYYYSF